MRTGIIASILNAGANEEELPAYLLRRIRPTNITALSLVFAIAIPFVIFSIIYVPSLVYIPLAGMVTCLGVIVANSFGYVKYARLFVAVLPVWEATAYNAFLCGPADEPIGSLLLVAVSFILVPFVVFDVKERFLLIGAAILCILAIVCFPVLKSWLVMDLEKNNVKEYVMLLKNGWLSHMTTYLAIIVSIAAVLGLSFINKKAEEESDIMRQEAIQQKEHLQREKIQRDEDLIKLKEAKSVEQRRQWTAEGIAHLSDILRGTIEEKEMFDQILAMVVKYLQANQGGLYVVNRDREEHEGEAIELAACYAYSRKKYLEQSFLPGQGIVGQTYLEGVPFYMTDVPADYVKITSGLGEATPTSLLVMPLKINEIVEGILEIASFKKFEQYEIEFIQKLGENIASYIQSNRVNVRTRHLLEQAQQQAEELKAQEEEMRQNMEELAATQEEMQRKEQEYQRKIHELELRWVDKE